MVAFSFRPRFVEPILAGTKRHTIRAKSKRRWPKPDDSLQLYTGMRTKACRLICVRRCLLVSPIGLVFNDDDPEEGDGVVSPGFGIMEWGYPSLDAFAVGDGFKSWQDLRAFWRADHRGVDEFDGFIVFWEPIDGQGQAEQDAEGGRAESDARAAVRALDP